ncbi:MAG: YbhB/YbcL family Raf kinase inhibitor-like protein, partial [Xanthomonadales bacterium]|nr:YbhB/YbcL family Raf kinase inhibitor-like protein [Xanthomonadales bacterium]
NRAPNGPPGSRQGLNDYGGFMGDGDYYGYDGPCPPWNDERVHRYHFRLYALDIARLPIEKPDFTASDVLAAIDGHVLAQAEVVGTYTLNRQLQG